MLDAALAFGNATSTTEPTTYNQERDMFTGPCVAERTNRPIRVVNLGYHSCGENWGFLSEHLCFSATYRCPACDEPITIDQCAAWPITQMDCPHCYETISCELSDQKGCVLR